MSPRVKYALYVASGKRRPVNAHRTAEAPLPGKITFCGRTYFWTYQDDIEGYAVYGDVKPQPR